MEVNLTSIGRRVGRWKYSNFYRLEDAVGSYGINLT
jgi:hypothetical protein